jgi:hypothetical protein
VGALASPLRESAAMPKVRSPNPRRPKEGRDPESQLQDSLKTGKGHKRTAESAFFFGFFAIFAVKFLLLQTTRLRSLNKTLTAVVPLNSFEDAQKYKIL